MTTYRDYMYFAPESYGQFAEMVHAAGPDVIWEDGDDVIMRDPFPETSDSDYFITAHQSKVDSGPHIVAAILDDTKTIYMKMAFADQILTLRSEEVIEAVSKTRQEGGYGRYAAPGPLAIPAHIHQQMQASRASSLGQLVSGQANVSSQVSTTLAQINQDLSRKANMQVSAEELLAPASHNPGLLRSLFGR